MLRICVIALLCALAAYPQATDANLGVWKDGSYSAISGACAAGTTTCVVDNAAAFIDNQRVVLEAGEEKRIVSINVGTNTLTFDSALASSHSPGTCNRKASESHCVTGGVFSTHWNRMVGWAKDIEYRLVSQPWLACVDGGSTDAYSCSLIAPSPLSLAITAYDTDGTCTQGEVCNGTVLRFKPNTANTGAATLAFAGLAAKAIKQADKTTDPADNTFLAGQWYLLAYDRTAGVWVPVGGGPASKLPFIDVTAAPYSAKGDGTTDDTAAFQAAVATGKLLFVPVGNYKVSSTVNIAVSGTQIECGSEANLLFTGSSAGFNVTADDVMVRGCTLDTTGTSSTYSTTISGLRYREYGVIRKGGATDSTENGRLQISASATITNAIFDGTNMAVVVSAPAQLVKPTCRNARTCIYVTSAASGSNIDSPRVESISGTGIIAGMDGVLIENANNVSVINPSIIAAREHGIYVSGTSYGATITGGTISGHCGSALKFLSGPVVSAAAQYGHKVSGVVVDAPAFGCSNSAGLELHNVVDSTFTLSVSRQTRSGIYILGKVRNIELTANAMYNTGDGLEIVDTDGAVENLYITNSSFSNNSQNALSFYGVEVRLTAGVASKNLVFRAVDASDKQAVATQRYGFRFAAPSGGSTLAGVTFENVTTVGNGIAGFTIGAGITGITTVNSDTGSPLSIPGLIESTSGGFKFPDGTTQTTASTSTLPTTTKGDVIVHNGTTNVRLAVGTNNQVLTADSAQTAGVKWADPSAGSSGTFQATITDLKPTNTSTVLTIAAGVCWGAVKSASTATITGGSGNGSYAAYCTDTQAIVVEHSTAAGLTVAGSGLTVVQVTTPSVPEGAYDIATGTISSGHWDTPADKRDPTKRLRVQNGTGMNSVVTAGVLLNQVNTATVQMRSDNYTPVAQFDASASTLFRQRELSSDPATCAKGEYYWNTTSTKGRRCTAVNTWADDASGGSSTRRIQQFYPMGLSSTTAANVALYEVPGSGAPSGGYATFGTAPIRKGLGFGTSATESIYLPITIPSDWSGSIILDVRALWGQGSTGGPSGDYVFAVSTACIAAGESLTGTSFGTATQVTSTDAGINMLNVATFSAVSTTGCAAGEMMNIRFQRIGGDAGDNGTQVSAVLGLDVTLRNQ